MSKTNPWDFPDQDSVLLLAVSLIINCTTLLICSLLMIESVILLCVMCAYSCAGAGEHFCFSNLRKVSAAGDQYSQLREQRDRHHPG